MKRVLKFCGALAVAASAPAIAQAATIWDMANGIAGGMGSLRNVLIYAMSIAGLVALLYGGWKLFQRSKVSDESTRARDYPIGNILLSLVAGVVLLYMASTTDVIRSTLGLSSAGVSSSNGF